MNQIRDQDGKDEAIEHVHEVDIGDKKDDSEKMKVAVEQNREDDFVQMSYLDFCNIQEVHKKKNQVIK